MQAKAKFRYIDSLRGIAVLAVLIVHCGQYGGGGTRLCFLISLILAEEEFNYFL
jgi:peptidoglycan/LPS O-acetylase OafA/YrhL